MGADASGLRREYTRYSNRVFREASRLYLEDLKASAPKVTGKTQRSGEIVNERRSGNRMRATIQFPTEGAFYTDEGKPRVIRPRRRGGVLAFFWHRAGRFVFFRRVRWRTQHPRWFRNRFRESRWAVAVGRAASRIGR